MLFLATGSGGELWAEAAGSHTYATTAGASYAYATADNDYTTADAQSHTYAAGETVIDGFRRSRLSWFNWNSESESRIRSSFFHKRNLPPLGGQKTAEEVGRRAA